MTEPAYLADACALIVMFSGTRSSPALLAALTQGEVFVSPVTVWEITRKAALGNLPIAFGVDRLLPQLVEQAFTPLPLTWDDAEAANRLPPHHKDPMDRMLIAQARRRGLTILTSDRIFSAYDVRVLW